MKKGKIILANVNDIIRDKDEIVSQIAPMYIQKYRSLSLLKEKNQELAAGYLLKKYLGINKDNQILCNKYGKPYLSSGNVAFNLSHSEEYVVLAIADREVGVDIEKIRKYHEATVKKVFNDDQSEMLEQLPVSKKDSKFTEIWTKMESILKLEGTGFTDRWPEIDYSAYCVQTIQWNSYFISVATREAVSFAFEIAK